MGHTYPARSCGSREDHGQHIHVADGRAHACFGYTPPEPRPLPIHRTEAGYPRCSTCDSGGCLDCTDPA